MPDVEIDDWVESPDSPSPSPEPAAPVATPAAPPAAITAESGPSHDAADLENETPQPEDGMERDNRGRWRRRARKDQATADDVPRIRELSRQLREAKQEIEAVKARVPTPAAQPIVRYAPPAPPVEFNDPEPKIDDFATTEDPYGEWMLARADWRANKRAAEMQGQHMQAHAQQTQAEVGQYWEGVRTSHQQRLMQAIQANPQHYQALQTVQVQPPPLLDWAIMLDKQSADVALFLATHPVLLDEFVLMTEAKPVTEQSVATIQRLLRQRMTAVGSGAVASSQPFTPAPRPPTPLRTAPMHTGETIPSDDDSLEKHEAFFHRNGRPSARRR